MPIFDKTAVEAAAKALGEQDFEAGFEDGDEESRDFWRAKTAISAAVASMRERAVMEDVIGYDLPGRQIISIRKETP